MNRITLNVALEVAAHEALIRQTYVDSVGVNTWSVGLTSATGHDVDRYIGEPQTLSKCLGVWIWALERYADDVREVMGELTEAQFAAALSFHWNTGAIKTASWVKHWKAGDTAKAKKAFMNWRKPAEIIPRRQKERDLFFSGVWSNDGTMTEYTRLTKSRTPVWRSAVKIDVTDELEAILEPVRPPVLPDAEPTTPVVQSPWAALFSVLAGLFKRG